MSDKQRNGGQNLTFGSADRKARERLRELVLFIASKCEDTPTFVSNYQSNPELTDVLKELIAASSLRSKAIETNFVDDSLGFSTCLRQVDQHEV